MNRPDSQFTLHKTTLRPLYIQPTYQSRHLPHFVVFTPYPLLLYICPSYSPRASPSFHLLLPDQPFCLWDIMAFFHNDLFIFCWNMNAVVTEILPCWWISPVISFTWVIVVIICMPWLISSIVFYTVVLLLLLSSNLFQAPALQTI